MNTNRVGNNKFQPREANAIIGQLREIEREFRIADIHRELDRNLRHLVERDFDNFKRHLTAINVAGIAFATTGGNVVTVFNNLGRIFAANDGRHAQFPRDDRRVASTAAAIGNNCCRFFHHRLPVGVGHIGDDHIAFAEQINFGNIFNHARRTHTDFAANGAAFGNFFANRLHAITRQHISVRLLRFHRFGTRLQDVELAVVAVASPLDIHRPAIVFFNRYCIFGELFNFGIA